jgi:hypothetical protein
VDGFGLEQRIAIGFASADCNPSGAKAPIDFIGFMRGLKFHPSEQKSLAGDPVSLGTPMRQK